MKIPDLETTTHALSLIGSYSLRERIERPCKWEVINGENDDSEFFSDIASVWVMINRHVASHINEFKRGDFLLEAYNASDEATQSEITRMLSNYHTSATASSAIDGLIRSKGYSPVSSDDLPENWQDLLIVIRSKRRLGLTLPAQLKAAALPL